MYVLWWHWLVLGMALIGLELVVPSFTIIWFGLGAVIVSIVLAIFPGYPLSAQIGTDYPGRSIRQGNSGYCRRSWRQGAAGSVSIG